MDITKLVVVLFCPTVSIVDKVLEYLEPFHDAQPKLHVLSSLPQEPTESDILILEFTIPVTAKEPVTQFITNTLPHLNTFFFEKGTPIGLKTKELLSTAKGIEPMHHHFGVISSN